MVSSQRIRVDESFIDIMGRIGRPIAERIKKQYNLTSLTIDHPTLSSIIAGKLNNKKSFNFTVHKISRDKGRLVLT